jgi:hypothetical protein
VDGAFAKVCGVDSRPSASSGQAFRGNDCGLEGPCLANDTTNPSVVWVDFGTNIRAVRGS